MKMKNCWISKGPLWNWSWKQIKTISYRMSSSNILPHAPPKKIYPEVPAGHFRLTRITEIERNFCRIWTPQKSCKKYKKAQTATHYAAVGLDTLASTLSLSGVAAGLTSPGITIGVPIGRVQPFIGLPLLFSTGAKKKPQLESEKNTIKTTHTPFQNVPRFIALFLRVWITIIRL